MLRASSVLLLFCALFCVAGVANAAEVSGVVRDGRGGEPLARVSVRLFAADAKVAQGLRVTDASGRFQFAELPAGAYRLQVESVEFRPVTQSVSTEEAAPANVEILLMPQWLREKVDVAADPFDVAGQATPGNALELTGRELQNLSSLLIADPLRSVQTLPSVASNDDFRSQFSVHGASFGRTGLVVDGVLLHAPFHAVGSDSNSASATSFPGEMLEAMTLHPGPPPVEFGDRSAAVLEARTRQGDAERTHARMLLSASNASGQVEGPWAKGKGTWLVGARKSYLQYIIERTAPDNTLAFAFTDAQGKFAYRLSPRHQVALTLLAGESTLDRTKANRNFGVNTLVESEDQSQLATLALQSTFGRVLASQRVAWIRETTLSLNRDRRELAQDFYSEWTAQSNQSWQWADGASLDFGGSVRRVRENGFFNLGLALPAVVLRTDRFRGRALRSGAFVRQNFQLVGSKVQGAVAARLDHSDANSVTTASPQASLAWQPARVTRVAVQWGQATQYPEIVQFFSVFTRNRLLPERATHVAVTLDQRLGERTRLRLEGYTRFDRDLLALPTLETRLVNGGIVVPVVTADWRNSQRGTARFFTAGLQRRTANGFEGWLGYTYGKATTRDGVLGQAFPSNFDQRHAVNVYGSYRWRASVNLSFRYSYGSGFPVPGYYTGALGATFLAAERNGLRFPAYQRWDVRMNKGFRAAGLHWTLFVEAINLTNRRNLRFSDYGGFNSRTAQVTVRTTTMLPLLPTAGLAVAW